MDDFGPASNEIQSFEDRSQNTKFEISTFLHYRVKSRYLQMNITRGRLNQITCGFLHSKGQDKGILTQMSKHFAPTTFGVPPAFAMYSFLRQKTASTQTLFSPDIQNQITSGFLQSKDGETSNLTQCSKRLPQHFWGFAPTLKHVENFQR